MPVDGMTAESRPTLSLRKKLAFALLSLALLVGAAEGLCRLFGLGNYEPKAQYISDWHHTPDGRTFWVFRGPGFNSDGLRDRQHDIPKPPGVHRIVCLGDSVTAGHGVRRSETYAFLLESFLQQLGLRVEVFNVAASGWSTRQEAAAYQIIARQYRPDHVFLGFCLNDVAEMHNNLTQRPSRLVSAVVRRSAFVRWVIDAEGRQVTNVEDLLQPTPSPAVTSGWAKVLAEIDALYAATKQDGCDLSVIIFPFRFQLDPGAPPPIAQRFLFQECHKRGIPCLDLLPALRALGSDAFLDESHLSPAGAAVVARELIRWGRTGCMMCGFDLEAVTAETCPHCDAVIQR